MEKPSGEYWLNRELYDFGGGDTWTVRDAVEGTQIFGATGSGKSSGSGRALATAFIRLGIGGVVLAAKSDEQEQWLRYFRQAEVADPIGEGRLRVIEPGGLHRFDPLAYEYSLAAEGGTRRLANLFMTALGSGDGSVASDAYWDDALRELLEHSIDLVVFGHATVEDGCLKTRQQPPGLEEIADVIKSAALSLTEVTSSKWLNSGRLNPTLLQRLDTAHSKLDRKQNAALVADMADTFSYWTRVFPSLAERTRSVILTSFTGKANDLLRRPLRGLFCSGDSKDRDGVSTVGPDVTHRGTIVLVDIPVKRYGAVGEFAQKLYKTVWQHATESDRRDMGAPDVRPTFLWADEAQHFVTKEDVLFQATARSKMAATVYLTQNISNYYSTLGGKSASKTDALLGSLQMKIFHTNGDPETNEWAERVMGQCDVMEDLPSSSYTKADHTTGRSRSVRTQRIVAGWKFTALAAGTGQPTSAATYIFHSGKKWNNEELNFKEHAF